MGLPPRKRPCISRSQRGGEINGVAARNVVLADYKRRAVSRGWDFEITLEQFDHITQQPCHYCGVEANKSRSVSRGGAFTYNGIDRKDNARGYNVDNCVPCCAVCNKAKGTTRYDDFIAWIGRAYRHINR